MRRQKNVGPDNLEILGDQPIVMVGQPGNLQGVLKLRNRGSDRLVLRELHLAAPFAAHVATRAAGDVSLPTLRLSPGVLRPGNASEISLSMALDPCTPPGEYQAQIDVAGQARQVVVHVVEKVSLRLSPSEVIVENLPDQRIPKRIVASNKGNVPLTIAEIGAIFLDDDLLRCRTLRAAGAAVGKELRPLDEYLAQILLQAKNVAERSGILRV